MAGRKRQLDDMASDAASDAARTLQELRDCRGSAEATPTGKPTRNPLEGALQDNVRSLLNVSGHGRPAWPNTLVRSRAFVSEAPLQTRHVPELPSSKRVCCSAEAASGYRAASVHSAMGPRGPGMWQGILN